MPDLSTIETCIWPELPGRPSRGLAMKQGVIPCLLPIALTTYLRRSDQNCESGGMGWGGGFERYDMGY